MKALIAMSGGVDSSVAALLTLRAGYSGIGCTMKLFEPGDTVTKEKSCCSLDDTEDAKSVAYKLGMPYYVFNFKDDFRECVIKKFAESYVRGETPNPCIDCNRYLKFDRLYERAKTLGCDVLVTGHYARIEYENGRYMLKKALDESKDQSYVLYSLTQEVLAHTLFPLGSYRKTEVRAIAEENGFINAQKRDSQDICFVPDGKYADVVEKVTGKTFPEGDYIDEDGNIIGRHKGIIRYTVGQHKHLGISTETPLYVKTIDAENNTVTLTPEDRIFTREVRVKDINLISVDRLDGPMKVKAKIRYRQPEQDAVIEQIGDGEIKLTFDAPVRAVTKGQAAVFYDGDTVVGGGTVM